VRPAAARDDRSDRSSLIRRRPERRGGSRRRAEVSDAEPGAGEVFPEPLGDPAQPLREELDLEATDVVLVFLRGEEIDQERAEARVAELVGDESVPRAPSAAAAAVGEQDDPERMVGEIR